MSIVRQLIDELRSYLRIETAISHQQGTYINVGEEFTLRVTISNTAPIPVVFTDFTCGLLRSWYAVPIVNGNEVNYINPTLPETELRSNSSMSFEVIMKAKATWIVLPPIPPSDPEPIAGISIRAKWKVDDSFYILKNSTAHANIVPS